MRRQILLDRALRSLHDAALDDALWPATTALIDQACGATGSGLAVTEWSGKSVRIAYAGLFRQGQHCEDLYREYLKLDHLVDECAPRLVRLPESQLVPLKSLDTKDHLKTSLMYNEALRRMGAQNGLNVRMNGPRGYHIFWATADPCQAGDWSSDQIDAIEWLLPHIRHFVWVRQALSDAEALGGSLIELLDNTRIGIIHLDHYGRIVEANDRARGFLQHGDGLSEKAGFLGARLPSDDANLQRLLAKAIPALGNDTPTGGEMAVRRSTLPSLILHVNPLAAYRKGVGLGRVAATVLVVDPMSQTRINPGLISKALSLTPAESRVAAMLAEGRTVREIAKVTGRQKGAVYWLLQQVYGKLGISRQVDLVRVVLSLPEWRC